MSTATMVPPEPAVTDNNSLRILPIVANLLPEEITDARRLSRVRQVVIGGVATLNVVLLAWWGLTTLSTSLTRRELEAAQHSVTQLQRQQTGFNELVQVQSDSKAISSQLASLFTYDLQWSPLVAAVRAAAPEQVLLTSLTGALDSTGDKAKAKGGREGGRLPSTTDQKLVGTLTLAGTAPSKTAVAAFVDALARVPGLADPFPNGMSSTDAEYSFTIQADLTAAAFGGRYTADPSAAPSRTPADPTGN